MKRASLSTMYGVGLVGIAPGTFGSAVAALLAYPILAFVPQGYLVLAAGVVLFTVLGTAHASRFMRDRNTTHDPKEIVIDELVGQWLTYCVWLGCFVAIAPSANAARHLIEEHASSPLYLALGFALFRFFDILKPWPISRVDARVKGGFGVMLDDLAAAIPAGLLLYAIHLFSPVLLGQTLEVNP